jgi:hypothetical protein
MVSGSSAAVVIAGVTVLGLAGSCSRPATQTAQLPPPHASVAPLNLPPPQSDVAELAEPIAPAEKYEPPLPEAAQQPMDYHSQADDRLVRRVLAGEERAGPGRSGVAAGPVVLRSRPARMKSAQTQVAVPPPASPAELGAQLHGATEGEGARQLQQAGLRPGDQPGTWSGTLPGSDGRTVTVAATRDAEGHLLWRIVADPLP